MADFSVKRAPVQPPRKADLPAKALPAQPSILDRAAATMKALVGADEFITPDDAAALRRRLAEQTAPFEGLLPDVSKLLKNLK